MHERPRIAEDINRLARSSGLCLCCHVTAQSRHPHLTGGPVTKSLYLSIVLPAASTALSAQTYTVIHHFGSQAGEPSAGQAETVAQSRGGALFATSPNPDGSSAAFRIWPGGQVQVLHQFGPNKLGYNDAVSGLTLATDGQFYGTTQQGGTYSVGSVFRITQDGDITTLYDFSPGSGSAIYPEYPFSAPIQSIEGDFYGNTGGGSNYASVYRITKSGDFTLLHTFTNGQGRAPYGPLVQGTDDYFYGTMNAGGPTDHGTIFRISSTGDFKVLVNFDGTNGGGPMSGLIQASDGNFYGVTFNGGPQDTGTLFRMTPLGTVTVLHTFTNGSEGAWPGNGLVQATDGYLYGTTTGRGKYGNGVLFRATLAGDLTVLHNFITSSGIQASSALIQHTNGKLYGFAAGGGKFGEGVAYSVDIGMPPFVTFLPTYGRAGALVQILGEGFTAASQVFFNGTPAASPVVVYPTYLRVIVPSGATSGPITVTTSTGTLTSNKVFLVHQ
jgi:uncharacterized repeat protein (TIGR03803 family)